MAAKNNEPNVIFVGKSREYAFTSYSDGMGPDYLLPAIDEQFASGKKRGKKEETEEAVEYAIPFYHAESRRLVRLYSDLYKFHNKRITREKKVNEQFY